MTLPASGPISALDIKNEFGLPPYTLGYNATDVPIKEYAWGGYLNYDTKVNRFQGTDGAASNLSFDSFHGAQRNWPVTLPIRTTIRTNTVYSKPTVTTTAVAVSPQNIGNFWSVGCNDYFQLFESDDVAIIDGLSINYPGLPSTALTTTGGIGAPGFPKGVPLVLNCSSWTCNLTGQENGVSWCFTFFCDYSTRYTHNRNPGIRLYDKDNVCVYDNVAYVDGPLSGTGGYTIPAFSYTLDPAKFPYKLRYRIEVKRQNFNSRCADNQSAWGITSLPTITIGPESYGFVSSPTSINEGTEATFNVGTLGIPSGTTLYWAVKHIDTVDADFFATSGSVTTAADGTASIKIKPFPDHTTEVPQTFQVELRTGAASGATSVLRSVSQIVTVNDTSLDPTYNFISVPTEIVESYAGTFVLQTTDIDDGTVLYWTIKHGTTVAADFTTSGSFTITSGIGSFNVTPLYDSISESDEIFQVEVRSTSTAGTILKTTNNVIVKSVDARFTTNPAANWPAGAYSLYAQSKPGVFTSSAGNSNFASPDGYYVGYYSDFYNDSSSTQFVSTGALGTMQLSNATSSNFSMEVYIKHTGVSGVFFSQGSIYSTPGWGIHFGIHKDGRPYFGWGYSTSSNIAESAATTLGPLSAGVSYVSVPQAYYGAGTMTGTAPQIGGAAGTSSATAFSATEDLAVGKSTFSIAANGYNAIFGNPVPSSKKYSVVLGYGIISPIAVNTTEWHHVAVSKNGSVITLYVDGNVVASYSNAPVNMGAVTNANKNTWGAHFQYPGLYTLGYTGYMSNFRIIKGGSQYNGTNFTPPTRQYKTDGSDKPAGSTLVGLLFATSNPLQLYNGGAGITLVNGSATGSSTGGVYTTTYNLAPTRNSRSSPQLDPATGGADFTIEFWVRFKSFPTAGNYVTLFESLTTNAFNLYAYNSGTSTTLTYTGAGGSLNRPTALALNTWYHVVFTRKNGLLHEYLNGSKMLSGRAAFATVPTPTSNYSLAGRIDTTRSLDGYMTNFRWVRDTAVYDTTLSIITVPTGPLDITGDTLLLTARSSSYNNNGSYGIGDASYYSNPSQWLGTNGLLGNIPVYDPWVLPFTVGGFEGAEGSPMRFVVTTKNLVDGTTLYWKIRNNTTADADFAATSGTATVSGDQTTIYITPTADNITENWTETFYLEVRTVSQSGTLIATSDLSTVFDSSHPVL